MPLASGQHTIAEEQAGPDREIPTEAMEMRPEGSIELITIRLGLSVAVDQTGDTAVI